MKFDYHDATHSLIVGDPSANRVWLDGGSPIFHDGFE
jgi:hypothetical protein